MEMAEDPFLPQRNQFLFATYAISAVAYRWVVVFSIMFFLNTFFKQYNLQIIGQMMTAMSLFGLAVYPLYKLVRFFMVPGRLDLVDRTRALISFAILGAVVAAIAFVPLPHRVYGTLELEPHGAENVYVSVPGALQPVKIKVGQKVTKGTILGQLENVDLKLAVAELTGRRNVLQTQVQSLQQRRYADAAAGAQLPEVLKTLAGVEEQLTEKQKDVARLDLVAPIDGTVLPPPDETPKPTPEGELTGWSGSPFQPKNQNAYLDESTLFCRVGDPRSLQALVIVDQSDVEFLREGMPVDIKLDEIPFITIHSEVRKIATESLDVSPKHLSNKAGGELATKTDESGIERPISTSYQVHVYPLDDSEGLLCIGLRGRAKIHVAPESLGLRLWRWFNQTFHFRL